MQTTEMTIKEIEVLALEAKMYVSKIDESSYIMLESDQKNIFEKIMKKIRSIVDKVKERVMNFIQSVSIKKKNRRTGEIN